MAKPAARLGFLKVVLALGVAVIVVRAFTVQVSQHDFWEERAQQRNVGIRPVVPKRGNILDRRGVALASTFEAYHVSVAQNELGDTLLVKDLLGSSLGLNRAAVERRFQGPYPYFAGPFDAAQVLPLRSVRGISLERVVEREGRLGNRARPMVGLTLSDGEGSQGIEASHDSLLQGIEGTERLLIDGGGRPVVTPGGMLIPPRPGHDLFLTIDH